MNTPPPSRPRLGSRAISEMNPLSTPDNDSSIGDLGRGTQATSGGAKVSSCGRTILGGIAPLSPFLALPTAPSAEELKRQRSQDENKTPNSNQYLFVNNNHHTRCASNSGIRGEPIAKKSRVPSDAAHMIRSYSMPVATQIDYEVQRQTILSRFPSKPIHNSIPNVEKGWPESTSLDKFGPNAMTSSASSMGNLKSQHRLHHPIAQRSYKEDNTPRLQPRTPLSIVTVNEAPQNSRDTEFDLGSGSDEAEVVTPRAISPRESYFGDQTSKESFVGMFENFEDFVHPDHLQPPTRLTL